MMKLKNIGKYLIGGVAAILVTKFALPTIGFTSNGVRERSTASRIHSMIGDVPEDSPFARFQSRGATGISNGTLGVAGFVGIVIVHFIRRS